MYDKSLKYEDGVDAIQDGADYVHTRLGVPQLMRMQEGWDLLNTLIRTSSLTKDGLFERRVNLGFVTVPMRPKDIQYARMEWTTSERFAKSPRAADFFNGLIKDTQQAVERMLRDADAPFELDEHVAAVMSELVINCAEHYPYLQKGTPWEVDLHASRSGVMLSTYQMGEFDLKAEFDRRMQLSPDRTPKGDEIPRPRYWYDFGNGDGFIRGNGLALLFESDKLRTNFRFEEEPTGHATRQFVYSDQHLKV